VGIAGICCAEGNIPGGNDYCAVCSDELQGGVRDTAIDFCGAGFLLGKQEPGCLRADAAGKIAAAGEEQPALCNDWCYFLVGGSGAGSRSNYVPVSARDHAADCGVRGRNPSGSRAAALSREIYSVERDYPGDVLDAGTGKSGSKPGNLHARCAGGAWECGSDAGQRSGNGETKDAEWNGAALQTCFDESLLVLLR